GVGIVNVGTIETLTSTGTITDGTGGGYAIYSTGSITSASNSGQIDGAVKLVAGGDTFTNEASGTITGNVTFAGLSNTLDNAGHINGVIARGNKNTVTNAGGMTSLDNTGTISGAHGGVANSGTIGSINVAGSGLKNAGSIFGGPFGEGLLNAGTITTL